jgi:topoisomerase IA-like protein
MAGWYRVSAKIVDREQLVNGVSETTKPENIDVEYALELLRSLFRPIGKSNCNGKNC